MPAQPTTRPANLATRPANHATRPAGEPTRQAGQPTRPVSRLADLRNDAAETSTLPPAKRPSAPPPAKRPSVAPPAPPAAPRREVAAKAVSKGKQRASPILEDDEYLDQTGSESDVQLLDEPPAPGPQWRSSRPPAAGRAGPSGQVGQAAGQSLTPAQQVLLEVLKKTPWEASPLVAEIREAGLTPGDNGSRSFDIIRRWAAVAGALTDTPTPQTDSKRTTIPSVVVGKFLEHSADWVQNALQVHRYIREEPTNPRMAQYIESVRHRPMGMNSLAKLLRPASEGTTA